MRVGWHGRSDRTATCHSRKPFRRVLHVLEASAESEQVTGVMQLPRVRKVRAGPTLQFAIYFLVSACRQSVQQVSSSAVWHRQSVFVIGKSS